MSMVNRPSPQVVTFGETMALFLPADTRGLEHSQMLVQSFGGAESNVAIGVARLGVSAGWFGRLGDDPMGRMILKRIRGEGVDVSRAVLTDEAPTGLMFRDKLAGKINVYYNRRGSAASLMKPEHLDETYIAGAQVLHITGITAALSESCRETLRKAVEIAKRHGVKVCFDPNLRLKLWSVEEARGVLWEIAKQADYFLPGLDEMQLLFGLEGLEGVLRKLDELPAVCIVKGGNRETYIYQNGKLEAVPYFDVERVVDPVGAGDGFCAGFLAGLVKGMDLRESVRLGNLVGSLVIQSEGDWESAPTWREAQQALGIMKHVER